MRRLLNRLSHAAITGEVPVVAVSPTLPSPDHMSRSNARPRLAPHGARLAQIVPMLVVLAGCAQHVTRATPQAASDAVVQIGAARARSNAAIAAHDTAAIAREWMPDLHVVSSTSGQNAGAAANLRSMQAQFDRRPDTRWVRTPARITVNERWDVAAEAGRWIGTWTDPDGPVRITGTYLAQWRRAAAGWRIQAEVFVPLECTGGAYCERRP